MTVKELASFFKVAYESRPKKQENNMPHKMPSQDDYFKKKSPEKPNKNHSLEVPKYQVPPIIDPFKKK